jgi:NAD(P)H dehydrogenase (quinone)
MSKALVIYYSRGGNTKKMAEFVVEGIKQEGMEVVLKEVGQLRPEELLDFDALVVGSPTYYGTMATEIKKLFDESVRFHGKLTGRVGAAFSSSANIAGGNETTVLDILKAMLIHGMVIQGDAKGDHYGPASIGAPDQRAKEECLRLGARVAELTQKVRG